MRQIYLVMNKRTNFLLHYLGNMLLNYKEDFLADFNEYLLYRNLNFRAFHHEVKLLAFRENYLDKQINLHITYGQIQNTLKNILDLEISESSTQQSEEHFLIPILLQGHGLLQLHCEKLGPSLVFWARPEDIFSVDWKSLQNNGIFHFITLNHILGVIILYVDISYHFSNDKFYRVSIRLDKGSDIDTIPVDSDSYLLPNQDLPEAARSTMFVLSFFFFLGY